MQQHKTENGTTSNGWDFSFLLSHTGKLAERLTEYFSSIIWVFSIQSFDCSVFLLWETTDCHSTIYSAAYWSYFRPQWLRTAVLIQAGTQNWDENNMVSCADQIQSYMKPTQINSAIFDNLTFNCQLNYWQLWWFMTLMDIPCSNNKIPNVMPDVKA